MKITKNRLKVIIKEELALANKEELTEYYPRPGEISGEDILIGLGGGTMPGPGAVPGEGGWQGGQGLGPFGLSPMAALGAPSGAGLGGDLILQALDNPAAELVSDLGYDYTNILPTPGWPGVPSDVLLSGGQGVPSDILLTRESLINEFAEEVDPLKEALLSGLWKD